MSRPKLPCGHDESPYGYPCPCEEPELYGNGDPLPAPTRWEYSDPNPPRRESETPPYGIPSLDPGLLPPDFDPDPWAGDNAPKFDAYSQSTDIDAKSWKLLRVRGYANGACWERKPVWDAHGAKIIGWTVWEVMPANVEQISVSCKFTV